jgi:hypothetical protein
LHDKSPVCAPATPVYAAVTMISANIPIAILGICPPCVFLTIILSTTLYFWFRCKNPKIEANFKFHIKEYKKAEYFLDNIQI